MLEHFGTLLPALLFLIAGGALVYFMGRSLLVAVLGNTRGVGERNRFKRREERLKLADVSIRKGEYLAALSHLEAAIFFDHVQSDLGLIDKVVGHHIGILGRLITISEEEGCSVSSLAVIEDLIHSRGDLMRAFFDAHRTKESLTKNRKKSVPRWAVEEYSKKMIEILERLATNRRSLSSQFDIAIKELRSPLSREHVPGKSRDGGQEDITIH
jgi:hypothetical protein